MDINLLKPNFERICLAFTYNESATKALIEKWEGIVRGEIPYSVVQKNKLMPLLEEHNMAAHYNDFLYIGNDLFNFSKRWDKDTVDDELRDMYHKELIIALNFLYNNNNTEDFRIELKHKTQNISVSIQHSDLLKTIKETLFKEYCNTYTSSDGSIDDYFLNISDITDWGIFFSIMTSKLKKGKKGRKKSNEFLGIAVSELIDYLQSCTELKAEEGKHFSRKQGLFIFNFLSIFQLISEEKRIWGEDNIRHILNSHYNYNYGSVNGQNSHSRRSIEFSFRYITEAEYIKSQMNVNYVTPPSTLRAIELSSKIISIMVEIEALQPDMFAEESQSKSIEEIIDSHSLFVELKSAVTELNTLEGMREN